MCYKAHYRCHGNKDKPEVRFDDTNNVTVRSSERDLCLPCPYVFIPEKFL